MTGVLAGVRVLEHGTFITGPAAACCWPTWAPTSSRSSSPSRATRSAPSAAASTARTSRPTTATRSSITLDTQAPTTSRGSTSWCATADVYIQNFRPGVADQIGVGEARLRELNPRLIYCAISGFGHDRPVGAAPSYDTVAQAASGFLKLLVNPANPRVVGPALADAVTGFYAAYGMLGALYERAPRRGAWAASVEVSMLEAMAHFNLDAFTHSIREAR